MVLVEVLALHLVPLMFYVPSLLVVFVALFPDLAAIFAVLATHFFRSWLRAYRGARSDAQKHGRDSYDDLHGALLNNWSPV
jgi:ABC-type anion transport system duplicated permease subunit